MSLNKRQRDMGAETMSHNDPISEGVPTLTDAYQQGWDDGVQDSMLRATQIERVLTDLIAELRSDWETYDDTDGHKSIRRKDDGWQEAAADRAEARLREVDTPPQSANDLIN